MKYYNTPVEEQETLLNILYQEQKIRIYSNRIEIIQNLTGKLGKPTEKYRKSKTYWSGASWDIPFADVGIIQKVLPKDIFIDKNFKPKPIKKKKANIEKKYSQISIDNIQIEEKPTRKTKTKKTTAKVTTTEKKQKKKEEKSKKE